MRFSDIPGNISAKSRLTQMVAEKRIPHALLISGPEGSGKLAAARTLAQLIHCEDPRDGEPCGRCNSCRLHDSMNHLDTLFVFPVVKTDKMTTAPVSDDYADLWREFINANGVVNDFAVWASMFDKKNAQPVIYVNESESLLRRLATTTHTSLFKIIVMWLPERMNADAANKLLKAIEEPFHDTLFVLVSNDPEKILPTIRSRCQPVEFKRLADDEIARWLVEKHNIEPSQALVDAHNAEGNMAQALRNREDDGDNARFLDLFVELMRLAYQRKVGPLRTWAAKVADLGREAEVKFFDYCERLIRENFILNFNDPRLNYMNNDELAFSKNFARFITERNAPRLIKEFDDARRDIAGNGNGKIVNFDLAIRVILLLK